MIASAVSAGTGASAGDAAPRIAARPTAPAGIGQPHQGRVVVEVADASGRRRRATRRPDGPAGTASRRPGAGRRGARRPPPSRRARSTIARAAPVRSRSGCPAADRPGRRCSSRPPTRTAMPRSTHSGSSSAQRAPGPGACSGRRAGTRPCRSRGRTGRASPTGSSRRRSPRSTPSLAEPVEGRVGAVDRRLPVVVRIVDERDVDARRGRAAPGSPRCDRRTPSRAVVEHEPDRLASSA